MLLKWNQVQAVADKLAGQGRVVVRPGDLEEPWQTLFQRLEKEDDPAMWERALWKATADLPGRGGLPDRQALVEEVMVALPTASTSSRHRSLARLAEGLNPVDWLWPGWIPRGLLSLLGAAPGAGKSLVALDLARRVIAGDRFPDRFHHETFPDGRRSPDRARSDQACPEGIQQEHQDGRRSPDRVHQASRRFRQGKVVYVDAEAVPQIQNERALAWGVDRSHLYLMLPSEAYGMIDFGDEAEQDRLLELVYDLGPELVVVDSLSSISMRGENSVEDVREILGFLGAVAREFRVGLLLIHHLRKRGHAAPAMDLVTADDFRGSTHIIAMARSVLALSIIQEGPEPDRNGPRRLEIVKTNLCQYPPALGVRFLEEGGGGKGEKGGGTVPWVVYGQAPERYREPTQAEVCAQWLVDLLQEAGAPLPPRRVLALAKEAGFKQGVLYRARKQLAGVVVDTEKKMSPKNRWRLAADSGE